ncbi:hypothetical protein E4K72_14200 [Oxalobacteraceae bacterium OM1]|nr:hypothetical protein E4K72_14200 [Oxalobacteraceae bacterium OM1]
MLAWALVGTAVLSGCNKTYSDVLASVADKLDRGAYSGACTEGEDYLRGKPDGSGRLAWALAKACAQTGDADQTISYIGQAIRAHAASGVDAMNEPLLEPLHTDPRFVALAAGTDASVPPLPGTVQRAAAPSVSAAIGEGGVEARAGDVSVKLPN